MHLSDIIESFILIQYYTATTVRAEFYDPDAVSRV